MGHRTTHQVPRARTHTISAVAGVVILVGAAIGTLWHSHHSGAGGQPTHSAPASTTSTGSSGGLPAGVSLQQTDGGANYFAKWRNSFPGSNTFIAIGVYPSESKPAALAAEGLNFFTPMRDETAGTWCPTRGNPNGNDMAAVNAQAGFYAGGAFYQTGNGRSWGSRAAFDVFGDELDGNANNWFDCLPPTITSHKEAGSWGGLSATGYQGAEAASHAADPTRPTYIQTTVTFMDGGSDYFYTLAQKRAICSGADIFSFDIYPLVLRGGHVWDMYDQVMEARWYCQDNRPVMGFTEIDHMNGGSTYPQPAQAVAEVWNAIIAGARGVQYFDQYSTITDLSYTGNGHYAAGAMYNAIKAVNSQITALAPVINAPFANGYVTTDGAMNVMAKYYDGHFYIFAIPRASGSRTITFTLAEAPDTTVTVLNENRALNSSNGTFTDTFANENTVHVYEVNLKYSETGARHVVPRF
jgi:hypothetical protein